MWSKEDAPELYSAGVAAMERLVRSVIEAYSRGAELGGFKDSEHAVGLTLTSGRSQKILLRVYTNSQQPLDYQLDRWE